jgi:hypothetical protein
MLDYYCTRINHVSRRAVCNTRHHLRQRMCTWLLTLDDRMGNNGREIPLTQEAVARQMGARRAGVNEIITSLRANGAVGHSRGRINLLSRERLEQFACVCYRGFRSEIDWCEVAPDNLQNVLGAGRALQN